MSKGPGIAQRYVLEFLERENAAGNYSWVRADAIACVRAGGMPTRAQVETIRRAIRELGRSIEATSNPRAAPVMRHPRVDPAGERRNVPRLVARIAPTKEQKAALRQMTKRRPRAESEQ